ncbi:DUF2071 domain-containing protein [Ramlibacter sp. WS9]|uniref:DUF2071 domain-containing protein n=1 Tax=Ramlibacter sp. WS9 TaxID=1882741 RepID=UPI001E5C95B8|nr:DUF2071 domain-containing protein [Ramlibacter sp. WS9]
MEAQPARTEMLDVQMPMRLKFADVLHDRPRPSGIDVLCKLQHFSIITYAFNPARFHGVMPPRFRLDTVQIDGVEKALISVVPFVDVDFTSAVYPFPKFRMGQTNYRIYIVDSVTNEKCVWFLGTTLDSWTVAVPRHVWNLPWYSGRVRFACEVDSENRYVKYAMETQARWAPARVEFTCEKHMELCLPGFPDVESGLVYLTHPLRGYYHRIDGRLGTYRVWHGQLRVNPGKLVSADFGLLERLGLVTLQEQQHPHSILVEPMNEFTIYLPPQLVP